uniref:Uncharacterized protein n=1 Tax=Sinocyclocheilus rhinocerous TaxID=307959 RepID=A0A673I4R9_9TELE
MDIESNFKLPKVDVSEFDHQESITVRQKDPTKVPLLKREEIEISGMEDIGSKAKVKPPRIKEQKVEKIIKISKAGKKQAQAEAEETFETDPKAYSVETKLKMPSIDVSVPKIKIPKAEGKSKQEETGLSKPEAVEAIEDAQEESGFRLIKFGISMPKEKTEEGGLLPDESEKSIIKVSGKTEVEPSELPQAEMKVAESKMKKRKISFPKFGFSKSDTKVSDADITLPAAQGSLHDADGTELDVESKTKDVEAEFKDSTDYPTKFKLPTIKFPKFGVSFPKTTDAGGDIQMPDVSTDEAKLPVEATALSDKKGVEMTLSVSQPEVDLSLPEGKAEIKGFQKKEIKSSEEMSFSKPDIDASLTGHDAEEIPAIAFSKQDIKAAGVDVSLPQVDLSIPEVSVEIKEPDLTNGGTPVKFPSISLPKFGGKSSKVVKDMPFVDIDTEEPHERLPETQISMQLKDDVEAHKPTDSAEKDPRSPTKIKRPTIKFPKVGVSFPKSTDAVSDNQMPEVTKDEPAMEIKALETELPTELPSLPEMKTPHIILSVSKPEVDDDQKDTTALGATAKFQLPSINIPKIGGQATKEEKTMPVVDIAVKGPEVTGPDTQISGEAPSVDIKRPHLATEGQSVSVDLNVEDAELGGQGGKFKMPKFGIGLPKVKGFDLKQDSKFLDVQIKPSPEFGFSKPEVKAPEVDVSIQKTDIPIPEGSMDLEEANVDIKVSKMESDQKGSTIFGSPTKFKLPSISLPKFGVKSQKVALDINVADSELEGTNIKTDISKPDVKLEVQTPKSEAKVEGSADMPEVDSKGLQVKVKKSSFPFPKFGFSKPDTATPEVNISVPKAEVSIPEVNVPVKEQTAQVTLPGGEAEQKDLMIVSSPTKFKLPEVNLPKFGVKTSKGTVSLPSADKDIKGIGITVHEPDIKLSGQIQKTELDVKEIETDIHATIRETDVHLAEGKVILPQPDVDVQDISIEGKADMSEVDLKGHDVKLKKPSFSLPKFGFSKTDIKGQDVDTIQPKADMSMQEGNIPVEDKDAEITITDEVKKQGDTTTQTKFKLPSINLPKFGLKYPKATADIPAAEVDIKEPEISFPEKGEVQTTDTETNIDIKGPSADVDIKVKEIDDDGTGSKFKLSKFGIVDVSLPKADIGTSVGNVDVSKQSADIKLPEQDLYLKEDTFGSPTRFKLPTISFPKFGTKASKD